jgi:apolipoprotein N-acyltransferase
VLLPDGSVVSSTPQFTPSVLVERIPLKTTTTLASHMRSVPEWVLAAIGVVGVGLAVLPRSRRKGAEMGTDG